MVRSCVAVGLLILFAVACTARIALGSDEGWMNGGRPVDSTTTCPYNGCSLGGLSGAAFLFAPTYRIAGKRPAMIPERQFGASRVVQSAKT